MVHFYAHMHILGLELGVIGGLIIPVCSYMLSESLLCHSTVVGGLPCVVLCCRFEPLPAQLVERSPRLQSVVGSNPTQGSFLFFLGKKELS